MALWLFSIKVFVPKFSFSNNSESKSLLINCSNTFSKRYSSLSSKYSGDKFDTSAIKCARVITSPFTLATTVRKFTFSDLKTLGNVNINIKLAKNMI